METSVTMIMRNNAMALCYATLTKTMTTVKLGTNNKFYSVLSKRLYQVTNFYNEED